MFSSPIGALLDELGKSSVLSLGALHLNSQNTCLIRLASGLNLQFEMDKYEKNLIIGSVLGEVQRGKYRNDLFREALKANGLPPPRYGTLAFSSQTESLVLHDFLDMRDLRAEQLAEYLVPFLEKAKIWQEAIMGNNLPALTPMESPTGKLGIFGLQGLRGIPGIRL
ncbi:MAG: CesT family type III secretion system chaperone [Parachlamydiaceae bacterium]|nr:CesT family type III secretion system chaperone [Parachlamydiaceae bacterium]